MVKYNFKTISKTYFWTATCMIKKLKDDLRKSLKKPASSVPEIPGAIEPAVEGSDSQDENEEVENHEPPEKGKSKKPKSKSSCCTIM